MKKYFLAVSLIVLPVIVLAADSNGYLSDLKSIVSSIGRIIGLLIPIVFALALLYFFWGLAKYILASGEGKEEGRNTMIWGVVALFVMASIWGIVSFIQKAFGVTNNADATVPTVVIPKK